MCAKFTSPRYTYSALAPHQESLIEAMAHIYSRQSKPSQEVGTSMHACVCERDSGAENSVVCFCSFIRWAPIVEKSPFTLNLDRRNAQHNSNIFSSINAKVTVYIAHRQVNERMNQSVLKQYQQTRYHSWMLLRSSVLFAHNANILFAASLAHTYAHLF